MDCHSADTGSNPVGAANERKLWEMWTYSGETWSQLMTRAEKKLDEQNKHHIKVGR